MNAADHTTPPTARELARAVMLDRVVADLAADTEPRRGMLASLGATDWRAPSLFATRPGGDQS